MKSLSLDKQSLKEAVLFLTGKDSDLAEIYKNHGSPPLWDRPQGFPTLVHIILEQQVSLASARTAFQKLNRIAQPLTPATFLGLSDQQLKQCGFSRQKTAYCRNLAGEINCGNLNLDALPEKNDQYVRDILCRVKGIGPWTANIYLLMALRRPDIWPLGDLALVSALQKVKALEQRPDRQVFEEYGRAWQPFRSVAARLLWHFYLSSN